MLDSVQPAPDDNSHAVTFDSELIRRYDRNGPRYTSYPTAQEFKPGFDLARYQQAAVDHASNADLSLYVHIPFCASPCFYCGCNKVITRDTRRAELYVQYLIREMGLQAALFKQDRPVKQLHFGGGTPTFLSAVQMQTVMHALRQHFHLVDDSAETEFSIEIDPRTLHAESLPLLAQLGFNRLSLGIQDFDPDVQAAVNRIQSAEATLNSIRQARELGFGSISVDLIYGLPRQTLTSFARTLDQIIAVRPDRLAVYGYAHMPTLFKPQRQINAAQLPDAAQRLALLQLTIQKLTDAGYLYIGMDHFALPQDSLVKAMRAGTLQRNFQGYSTHAATDLIGLGVSAIGSVGNVYVQNARALGEYYRRLDNDQLPIERGVRLSKDDELRRAVIQQLMCNGTMDYDQLSAQLGIDVRQYFARELDALQSLAADGLIEMNLDGLRATPPGRLLIRHVAMVFDAYLAAHAAQTFSKAI